jgi:hypothetical protein
MFYRPGEANSASQPTARDGAFSAFFWRFSFREYCTQEATYALNLTLCDVLP